MIRIKATKVRGRDLKTGDLFYWDRIGKDSLAVGEKVYIRTDNPIRYSNPNRTVYRITIEKVGEAEEEEKRSNDEGKI